mmetsp:Transcript_32438/g.90817  ORF Transcript_32438/g.90817 Transcript_32438/m.90817 type:complete len:172 (+) Transcript_32438:85-600(+)|eukprot:CAMPEP_0119118786 /NCGR_PEP_ID=MMETSP1310-20130426/546_1 /TAXON_ID=464262 /ORGANISM="Genus nov. species nov., Strain RCC2339" /LENGTH=171 /DNA_ID=CAMNT_0007108177 /DNA_START=66 /DNA_END=581 /DNA_ORIENTATION=+
MKAVVLLLVAMVMVVSVSADLPCTSVAMRCCHHAIRCLTAFTSEVNEFRGAGLTPSLVLDNVPEGSTLAAFQNETITVENTCPKGLVRDCPLGYDYFPDVNSAGENSCQKRDQSILGGSESNIYNPDQVKPFDTIQECIISATAMSYSADYCLEPFHQAMRHCLLEIGRKG